MSERQTIGRYLLDRLQQMGADHVFTVPGDYSLSFNQLCESHPIEQINATRENTAAFMADAYARKRGIGVACITYGVGINVVSALSQAYSERSPVVVICGSPTTSAQNGRYQLHHCPRHGDNTQLKVFEQVTAAQAVLKDPAHAAWEIERVLEICHREKQPVYIEIPREVVHAEIEIPEPHLSEPIPIEEKALMESLTELRNILSNAKKPVIWAGADIGRFGLTNELLSFAEKYQIPIATALLGKTVIDESHPLHMGIYQGELSSPSVREYMKDCDCVLALGVVLSDVNTGVFSAELNTRPCIIANPTTLSINHHNFEGVPFRHFIQNLTSQEDLPSFSASHTPFQSIYDNAKEMEKGKALTSDFIFSSLQGALGPEHTLVTGIGDSFFGTSELRLPQDSLISNALFLSLGFCIPAAIGLSFACPDKRIIAVVGDGDFQMSGMELGTATRYGLDPIIVLLNNHGYGIERPLADGPFNDVANWNYHQLPAIFGGGQGRYEKTECGFQSALKEALANRGDWWLIEADLDKMDLSTPLKNYTTYFREKQMQHKN